jgi:hypothetical protein
MNVIAATANHSKLEQDGFRIAVRNFLNVPRNQISGQAIAKLLYQFQASRDRDFEMLGTANPVELMQIIRQDSTSKEPLAQLAQSLQLVINTP